MLGKLFSTHLAGDPTSAPAFRLSLFGRVVRKIEKAFKGSYPNKSLPCTERNKTLSMGQPLHRRSKLLRIALLQWFSPFTSIIELGLTNGIHLRYPDLVLFLRHTSNLLTLRLINIKFVDGAPQVVEETVRLPHLTEFVLVELIEPIGLGHLYASLDAPKCETLHLDLRPSVAVMRHPTLPARVAPVVQRALARGKVSFLLFHRNTDTQSASWRSQDEGGRGRSEKPSFDITFRGTDSGLAGFFSGFVRGVRVGVGETGNVVVDVGDSVSGAIDEPFCLELDAIVPTLFPDSFEGLNIVERLLTAIMKLFTAVIFVLAFGPSLLDYVLSGRDGEDATKLN